MKNKIILSIISATVLIMFFSLVAASAPYAYMNGTLAGNNVMYFFVYANDITNGFAVPLITTSFFLLVFISSIMMQLRFSTRIRPDTSMLAASFATFGWCVILEQQTGLLNPIYFFVSIGLTILSLVWVAMGSD